MGFGRYDSDDGVQMRARLASTGKSYFTHDDDIRTGLAESKVHELLDPSKPNKLGQIIRESRDSKNQPNSRAVAVIFDVTGSMRRVPQIFKDELPKLMNLLVEKDYIADPHILFGAIGDATGDKVPLQIGQFEAGKADEAFQKIYLEGNGQTNQHESYELAMYFMAKYTAMDCLEKRNKKGYLFIFGDENPFDYVSPDHVNKIIGKPIKAKIPVEQVIHDLQEMFEVFWITPSGTTYWNMSSIVDRNRYLFGQRYIRMEHPEDVCNLICTLIGVNEGYDVSKIGKDLQESGASKDSIDRSAEAVAEYIAAAAKA